MQSKDFIPEELDLGPMSPENLNPIREIFTRLGKEYRDPYKTTTGTLAQSIKTLEQGNHTGIYFIYGRDVNTNDLAYFYIGLAGRKDASSNQNILQRFETHYYKLTADLVTLWGGDPNQVKDEPKWQFPAEWRKGVSQQFLGGQEIPAHFQQTGTTRVNKAGKVKKLVTSANLDFVPQFQRDPMQLPMLIWNLDDFSYQEIEYTETSMIRAFRPLFNTLTGKYNKEPELPTRTTIMAQPAVQKSIRRTKAANKVKAQAQTTAPTMDAYKNLLTQLNIKGNQIVNALGGNKVEAQQFVAGLRTLPSDQILARLAERGLDLNNPQILQLVRTQANENLQ